MRRAAYLLTFALLVSLAAGCGITETPTLVPTVASQPVAAETSAAGGTSIDPSSVSIDTMGLPYSWQANLVSATPYDNTQPPGPSGLPEHIQINFGVTDPRDKQPGDPVIYIIPVEAYRQLWEENGDQGVSITVDALLEIIQDRPETFPTRGIPVLPFEEVGGVNDLAVQGSYPDYGALSGLRFVGRFARDPNPVTNEGLRYIFQGFAGDASDYFIAFFYPVTTSALPSIGDVSAAEQQRVDSDPEAYLGEKAEMLNALAESDWDPSLSILDSVLASLRFQTTASGEGL